MKKKWILAAVFITVCMVVIPGCGADAPKKGTVTVEQYEMDLKLDTEKKELSGTVQMDISNDTDGVLNELVLRNYAASILRGKKGDMSAEFTAAEDEQGRKLVYTAGTDPSVVTVNLEQGLKPGASMRLQVTYRTDIPRTRDRFGYYQAGQKENYLLSFCFPVLSMFENGSWNKSPYIFDGECTYSRVTNYRVRFTAPKEFLVAASGEERTENGVTEIRADHMRDMAITASNNMKVETKTVSGVRINSYTLDYEGTEEYNRFTLDAAADSAALYTELFGKYPYEELDIIQCFDEGGMEYPGLILIGLPDIAPAEEIGAAIAAQGSCTNLCMLVAHETAHQWFYAAVGNDQYQEAWLDESFANYCEDGIYGLSRPESLKKAIDSDTDRFGEPILLWWDSEKEAEEHASHIDADDTVINMPYDWYTARKQDDYTWQVYVLGECFLYELRKTMGDETFFDMMQDYYRTFCLKTATGEDFIEMVRAYDRTGKTENVLKKYLDLGAYDA